MGGGLCQMRGRGAGNQGMHLEIADRDGSVTGDRYGHPFYL